jgi:hypothetical protein
MIVYICMQVGSRHLDWTHPTLTWCVLCVLRVLCSVHPALLLLGGGRWRRSPPVLPCGSACKPASNPPCILLLLFQKVLNSSRGSCLSNLREGKVKARSEHPCPPAQVAYWKFDEGSGYQVKDATGKGHDLLVTQPPRWEVSHCGRF